MLSALPNVPPPFQNANPLSVNLCLAPTQAEDSRVGWGGVWNLPGSKTGRTVARGVEAQRNTLGSFLCGRLVWTSCVDPALKLGGDSDRKGGAYPVSGRS
eukprot:259374-Chlamydomonas_euryale.AAC.1